MSAGRSEALRALIRTIADYPRPGIQFRDITTLLLDARGLRDAVAGLSEPFRGARIDKVAGIEARGLILGGAVALELDAGFAPVRKRGKLPWDTIGEDYALEYGTDRIEMHRDAVAPGERVLVVDDLIATGGTAEAAIRVIQKLGGEIVGCACIIDLPGLGGSRRIEALGHRIVSLVEFEGE
jgi:adenine phosphoribosyltransferase